MYQPPKHSTVANVVPAGDFQQLQAQLEDTQESLAAAFARIEVFRLREKLLLAELAKSRIAGQPTVGTAAAEAAGDATAVAAAGTAAHGAGTADVCQQQVCSQPGSSPPQQQEQQQQQQVDQQADWPLPCYVTEVEGHLPVMLISSGGRKTPGSVVITADYVDFVEVRARVKRHDFVGFTSAPALPGQAKRMQSSATSSFSAAVKQLLPSCLSPEPGSPQKHGRVVASDSGCYTYSSSPAADGSGSSSVVQLAAVDGHRAASSTPGSPSKNTHSGLAGGYSSPRAAGSPRHQQQHSSYAASPQQPAAAWYPTDAQQQQQHLQPHSSQQQPQQQAEQHELHAVGPWVSNSSSSDKQGGSGTTATGVWRILWRSGGLQQHLTFEATQETREALHRHTNRWLHGPSNTGDDYNGTSAAAGEPEAAVLAAVAAAAAAGGSAGSESGALEIAIPRHLTPGAVTPRLSEPSIILTAPGGSGTAGLVGGGSSSRPSSPSPAAACGSSSQHQLVDGLAHLAAALPPRYQARGWSLLYSTSRHGISLQTLYRRCAGNTASVLLVRDAGGYVFGAFCTEAWRPSARFFGTGEMFVFQLAPHKVMFPWQVRSAMKNDFFMYAQQEAMAVGGLGAFAIWLDAELLQGSSGSCGTFGSPCLASKEEFKVAAVELWGLQ